jgi:hypothetical protein
MYPITTLKISISNMNTQKRDSMICDENDVEVFIGSKNGYYEFELNALGTIMERFYIWQNTSLSAGYSKIPEFDLLGTNLVDTLGGSWSPFNHPRGRRWAFREWDMPSLKWAVQVNGTINNPADIERGWTAEIAFPWLGAKSSIRILPPVRLHGLGRGRKIPTCLHPNTTIQLC